VVRPLPGGVEAGSITAVNGRGGGAGALVDDRLAIWTAANGLSTPVPDGEAIAMNDAGAVLYGSASDNITPPRVRRADGSSHGLAQVPRAEGQLQLARALTDHGHVGGSQGALPVVWLAGGDAAAALPLPAGADEGRVLGLQDDATALGWVTVAVDGARLDSSWAVRRSSGQDRYATAVAISRQAFPSSASRVYVATGRDYPDVLAAGPAAGINTSPILLVDKYSVPAIVADELARLRPDEIVIVGGAGVVSTAVESRLRDIGPVTRLAGSNRYATAAAVARDAFPNGSRSAFLATGTGYADALAAGPAGARRNAPLALTHPDRLDPDTAQLLEDLGVVQVVIVGGSAAVSPAVERSLRDAGYQVTRVGGADRYQTAATMSQVLGIAPSRGAFLATGTNFPDALGAGAAAGAAGEPLLLTRPGCMPTATWQELERLGTSMVNVAGGTGAVSNRAAYGGSC
jgi:putative cell wall-binding protein